MKILYTIESVDAADGGPVRSALGLLRGSQAIGLTSTLLSFFPKGERNSAPEKDCVIFGQERSYMGYKASLERVIRSFSPDLIYIHGCWSPCRHAAAVVARRHQIPYIVAPRGSFYPWSLRQKAWKKKLALWLYQQKDMQKAIGFHATSLEELCQMEQWFPSVNRFYVPNGVIIPAQLPPWIPSEDQTLRFISVSRIHYVKGYELLFAALAKVAQYPWALDIIGGGDSTYIGQLKNFRDTLGLTERIRFRGEMNDSEKWQEYRRADVFLLATHSENFGISIAEALYAELPVLTTRGAPWKDLCVYGCGWWVDRSEDALVDALHAICQTPKQDLRNMGERGQRLILDKYTWEKVARMLIDNCESLLRNTCLI